MKTLSIRSLEEKDIPSIVNYWFDNTDESLLQMGADKTKLSSKTELTHLLLTICNTPLDKAKSYYMI